jgi:transcriptional regulator with XRE-family HTH domain
MINGPLLDTLAANLRALMAATPELHSQTAVAKRSGMDQRTVGRILNREHSPTLVQLEKPERAFGVAPWQLMMPRYDPADPPTLVLSTSERDAWTAIRVAAESIAKYRAR